MYYRDKPYEVDGNETGEAPYAVLIEPGETRDELEGYTGFLMVETAEAP